MTPKSSAQNCVPFWSPVSVIFQVEAFMVVAKSTGFEDDEYIEVTSLGDVASVQINGAGQAGLVVLRESGSELFEFRNTSSSSAIRLTLQGSYGVNASDLSKLAVADFDGNGEMDVAMTSPGRVLLRRSELFTPGPPFSFAGVPTNVDIDGDADQDLISASFSHQWNLVRNDGSGRFGALEQGVHDDSGPLRRSRGLRRRW